MTTVRQNDGDSAIVRWRQYDSATMRWRQCDNTMATMRLYDDDSAAIRWRPCDITVAGVSVEGDIAQLLLRDDEVVTVSSELLLEALPEGNRMDLEHLTINGTVDLNIELKGTEVLTVQFIQ
ncbi:hypothetical protein DPMN_064877 [Dreissena polymorpha]|uniref:Uncharacterized protein n=1 Tax=Dreissena polymorpha TaxID=45954 RepID=A0A9D4CD17_DREPO|nr:hypothetical protein DPMN_064877 [Dreissena polymorpha]